MRIARFKTKDNRLLYGIPEGSSIKVIEGDIFGEWKKTKCVLSLDDVKLLAPVEPPNIIALGLNYKEHAKESNENVPAAPVVFLKAISALNHPDASIVLPRMAPNEVDYEAELAVIIGKMAKDIAEEDAPGYILGYTCGNDVSARDCQLRLDKQWARGKSFDTFAPLGPWIETELNPNDCEVILRLNGKVMQESSTSLMIFNVPYIVSYLSRCMTLLPGTAIMTGTPSGVGYTRKPPVYLRAGDRLEVEIKGIGVLRNMVTDREAEALTNTCNMIQFKYIRNNSKLNEL